MQLGRTKDFVDSTVIPTATPTTVHQNVAGLTAGTTVMTLDGETPVENLQPGARIITRDAGMSVLRDVRKTKTKVSSIKIKAGSLGHTRPQTDVAVGPDTLVHIRDWRAKALFGSDVATVKAKRLLDGDFVCEQAPDTMLTYELVFDRQHIIYADGLEVASTNI